MGSWRHVKKILRDPCKDQTLCPGLGRIRYNIPRIISGEITESGKRQYGFMPKQNRAEVKKHDGAGAAKSVPLSPSESSLADKIFTLI